MSGICIPPFALEDLCAPREVARRIPLDYPDDPEMRVGHGTIYQSLFVQGRRELRRELARRLRSGRTCRKKRGTADRRGGIPGTVNISERLAEADDPAVPGHWEGGSDVPNHPHWSDCPFPNGSERRCRPMGVLCEPKTNQMTTASRATTPAKALRHPSGPHALRAAAGQTM